MALQTGYDEEHEQRLAYQARVKVEQLSDLLRESSGSVVLLLPSDKGPMSSMGTRIFINGEEQFLTQFSINVDINEAITYKMAGHLLHKGNNG